MANLKNKLNIISGNVLDRVIQEEKHQKSIAADPYLGKITAVFEGKKTEDKK